MFQYFVYSLANRQGLFVYVRICKTRLDTTTKFMVVVTSLFNLVISSFADNMFYHVWTWLLIYNDAWFQQRCSSLFVHQAMQNSLFQHAWTSLSTTIFKPVNRQNKLCVCFYLCSNHHRSPVSLLAYLIDNNNRICIFAYLFLWARINGWFYSGTTCARTFWSDVSFFFRLLL